MTNVIIQRYITTTRDMDAIEAAITTELGGENHRCSFLRSQSYLMLRLAALYKEKQPPCAAYFAGLKVALDWTNAGKRVTLQRIDCQEYYDEQDMPQNEEQEAQQRKAPRL